MKFVAHLILRHLPFFVLCLLGFSMGTIYDLWTLPETPYLTFRYGVGLLARVAMGFSSAFVIAFIFTWVVDGLHSRVVKYILALLAIVVGGVCLFMVSSFGVRLTPDILVLIKETNMVELGDFFTMYLSSSQNLLYLALGTVVFLGYYFCDKLYAEKFFKTGF